MQLGNSVGHSFRVLSKHSEWQPIQPILEREGGQLPVEGTAVIFAEFDEENKVVAFQILHTAAIFAEGLWARDGSAHLRTLWHQMHAYLLEQGCAGRELLTMTRGDETGERIGRLAKYLGCEKLNWSVYRRKL